MAVTGTSDQRLTLRERGEEQRTVADRLVAREAQFTPQPRCGVDAVRHALLLRRAGARRPWVVMEWRHQRVNGAQLTSESLEHWDGERLLAI